MNYAPDRDPLWLTDERRCGPLSILYPNNERFQQFRNRWGNLWRDLTPICPSNFFSIRYHRKLETYIFEKFVLSFVLFAREGGNISKGKKCYVFIPQQSGRILLTRNTKHESIKCEEGRRSRNEKRFFTERTKNSRRIEFFERRLGILNENSTKSKHRRMFAINIVELHGWINWRSSSFRFIATVFAHWCARALLRYDYAHRSSRTDFIVQR